MVARDKSVALQPLREKRLLNVGEILARMVFLALRNHHLFVGQLAHNGAHRNAEDGDGADAPMAEGGLIAARASRDADAPGSG